MANLPAHEIFLRFESLPNTTQLMRARAVYLTGLAFIATQLVNIFFMTISYGGWTHDHAISLAGCIGVVLVMLSLRYTKNFHYFAIVYSVMLFAGIGMSASVDATGIETALLPLLIVGALLNGFIGGWRHIALYGFVALMFIWKLYNISLMALLAEVMDDEESKTRIFQRAMQASLALFMTAVCTSLITHTMTKLFDELDKALSKVNTANQQKIDFLAHMSQELGRPIAGINSGVKKLVQQNLSQNEKTYTQVIQTYSRRLSQIISDVMILSNMDQEKFTLTSTTFNLRSEMNALLSRFEPIAVKKGLHLGITYAAHLPETYQGDQKRIRQILKNLIHNSFKHTQTGSVHIYADGRLKGADDVQLCVRIKDTGQGMSEADIEQVFDRFTEKKSQKKPGTFAGTGLELSICYELAQHMGGDLSIESQKGVGSTFELNLTLKVAGADALTEPDLSSGELISETAVSEHAA